MFWTDVAAPTLLGYALDFFFLEDYIAM